MTLNSVVSDMHIWVYSFNPKYYGCVWTELHCELQPAYKTKAAQVCHLTDQLYIAIKDSSAPNIFPWIKPTNDIYLINKNYLLFINYIY